MKVPIEYHLREKLHSVSERIKFITKNNNTYLEHTDPVIGTENLKWNLSLVLSHIIFNLSIPDYSKTSFKEFLTEYNRVNGTDITFSLFEQIGWIRVIEEDITISSVVASHIRSLVWESARSSSIVLSKEKNNLINCLKSYYIKYHEDSQHYISNSTLVAILAESAHPHINIDFLLRKEILKKHKNTDLFIWSSNNYTRYLNGEIVVNLWLLSTQHDTTSFEFNTFRKLIHIFNLHIDNITQYFKPHEYEKIVEMSVEFLKKQNDFLRSDIEFEKIWLDSAKYLNKNLSHQIPKIHFCYDDVYSFVQSVTNHKLGYHDMFDYQTSRAYIFYLLTLIKFDLNTEFPYHKIISFLKDIDRPFLLWMLYRQIPKTHQEIIPYLLQDFELMPLVFRMVDDFDISELYIRKYTDRNQQLTEKSKIKNDIFEELFDIALEVCDNINYSNKQKGEAIIKILLDTTAKLFTYYSNDSYISHKEYQHRYDSVIKKIVSKRDNNSNRFDGFSPRPKFIINLLPYIILYLLKECKSQFKENIVLDLPYLDSSIEILRISNSQFSKDGIVNAKKVILEDYSSVLIKYLCNYLIDFYTIEKVDVSDFFNEKRDLKQVYRGLGSFGQEIIDWGYLFLLFEKHDVLDELYSKIINSVNFNTKEEIIESHNLREVNKLKTFLKSFLLAFIGISSKTNEYEVEQLPVSNTIKKLKSWIEYFSTAYSIDDILKSKVNLFDEKLNIFTKDLHYQSIPTLFFKALNIFDVKHSKKILKIFFDKSIDIGNMVTSINIFDSKVLRSTVAESISKINIENYIDSRFTVTELQETLIEVINSDDHWKIAVPLIDRIKDHLKKYDRSNEHLAYLLYNVDLLLAFREKNLKNILDLEAPKEKYIIQNKDEKAENLRKFFIGLHHLHNEKNFDKAILFFELISSHEESVRYSFHLFRAQTLKAVKNKDQKLLGSSFHHWENISKSFRDKGDNEFLSLKFAIASNQLYYFHQIKDLINFKQNINLLPETYLYDKEIIPIVYEYYRDNELPENAFSYLTNAIDYLQKNKLKISKKIKKLQENSITRDVLLKFKSDLNFIRNLDAHDIPLITPDIINNKRNLNDFILNEFIQASKIMTDKIHGIKMNPHEDRFNDLLMAILRLRFQVWSWSVHDQARKGSSSSGKNAGETDITIEAGNITIALVEALVLEGKDISKTQNHIKKIFSYSKNLERYYMIVYYRGSPENIDSTWISYKNDIRTTFFDSHFSIDVKKDFVNLENDFNDINHLKLAKTVHGKNIEVFHILINLSENKIL